MNGKNKGYIIILVTLLITGLLWLLSKKSLTDIAIFPLLSVSQITALFGTLLFSWSMFLSTRLDFLEDWFNGLDKVYLAHKKVSIWGMSLISIHVVALVLDRLPNFNKALNLLFPLHQQIYLNFGAISFWSFIFLVGITLYMKKFDLPYHLWKFLHKFTGPILFLAFIHILLIPGGMSSFSPFNFWVFITTGAGIASWLYYEFFYKISTPSFKYKISRIKKKNDTYKISLRPLAKKMPYQVGQFAYLSFVKSAVAKEVHPFSMTSHPNEKKLSFAIKKLGDYTNTLDKLKVEDIAQIWGPYGRFSDKFLKSKKDSIFIGGGIGIAPFISMIKDVRKKGASSRKVSIFYCTKYKYDACFDHKLSKESHKNNEIYYLNKCSREDGRITITEILSRTKNPKNTLIFICGPRRMTSPLVKNLTYNGIPKQNIIAEDFEFM